MSKVDLPEAVARYLDAHRVHDTATALAQFCPDATVVDEGITYTGGAAIADWLNRAASEYTYTIELTASERLDATHVVAFHHLEGNFPGGVADLRHQFTLADGGRIARLIIEP